MTTQATTRLESAVAAPSDTSLTTSLRRTFEHRLDVPPWVLLIQVFIGLGWLRAAVEKVIDPSWWDGAVLSGFLDAHAELTLPWYQVFIDSVVEPNVLIISTVVAFAQFFAGFALVTGWRANLGLSIGLFLNFNFVAAGAVNPSLFYIICQIALFLWVFQESSARTKRPLRLLSTVSICLVLLNIPFISTLEPAAVVEDPAITLVTVGILTAVASQAGIRHPSDRAAQTDSHP